MPDCWNQLVAARNLPAASRVGKFVLQLAVANLALGLTLGLGAGDLQSWIDAGVGERLWRLSGLIAAGGGELSAGDLHGGQSGPGICCTGSPDRYENGDKGRRKSDGAYLRESMDCRRTK